MDVIDFISSVYFCLAQNQPIEHRLKSALDKMKEFLNLDIASIILLPGDNHDFHVINSGSGDKEHFIEEYKDRFFYVDQFHDLPEGEIVVFEPGSDTTHQAASEFSDFCLEKVGIKSVAGADFRLNKTFEVRLRLTRTQKQGVFSHGETEIIKKLLPPLKNAIDQAMHTQCRSLFDSSAQKLLARFRIGIIIVNKNLEIIDKSLLAEDMLIKSNVFSCNNGRLVGISREYQQKIENMLYEVNSNDKPPYKTLHIASSKTREMYTLAITKNSQSDYDTIFSENRFTLFIFSSIDDNIDMSSLLNLWRISPAEQRVLGAIMRFDNVKKAAIELNISPNTVKAQLKSVYSKLGIESKTMLVKRVNSVRNMVALLS